MRTCLCSVSRVYRVWSLRVTASISRSASPFPVCVSVSARGWLSGHSAVVVSPCDNAGAGLYQKDGTIFFSMKAPLAYTSRVPV